MTQTLTQAYLDACGRSYGAISLGARGACTAYRGDAAWSDPTRFQAAHDRADAIRDRKDRDSDLQIEFEQLIAECRTHVSIRQLAADTGIFGSVLCGTVRTRPDALIKNIGVLRKWLADHTSKP